MKRVTVIFVFSTSLTLILNALVPMHARAIEVHGFWQGNYSVRLGGANPADYPGQSAAEQELIRAEERIRLEGYPLPYSPNYRGFFKLDLFHDTTDGAWKGDLREAYFDYYSDKWDLRVGRQLITWGVGDLVFISDVWPKNWDALLTGMPLGFLKTGVDGVKLNYYAGDTSYEFVTVPFFTEDKVPDGNPVLYFDPISQVTNRAYVRPKPKVENTELAVKVSRKLGDWDANFYAYRGYWRQPGVRVDMQAGTAVILHPRLNAYAVNLQKPYKTGMLSLEAGYYDSVEDRGGTDFGVENSQVRALISYSKELRPDFTVGVQSYTEWMMDYGAYKDALHDGTPKRDRLRQVFTLRLTEFKKYQTVKYSLMSFYSPTDNDYYVNPEVSYKVDDRTTVTVGMNIFGGADKSTFFGQFTANDNLYLNYQVTF